MIVGGRNSFLVSFSAVLLGTIVGAAFGLVSGYRGGTFDLVAQRITDMVMTFPLIVLAMLLVAALGPTLLNVVLAIGIALAPRTARLARAAAMSLKQNMYVEAAIALGATETRLLLRHILPNLMVPLITLATAQVGGAIIAESSLSFLGVGLPIDAPSWGKMLTSAQRYAGLAPWLAIVPGLAISLAVFSINIVGDTLRDLSDPTLRRATIRRLPGKEALI
jgi:ABC-type dipeptide/oligopeptide/nickel transport system permease subunit